MKTSIIIIQTIYFSLFAVVSFSQPCLPDGITFTTQLEIDDFQTIYPNCTEIEGDVTISGDSITSLYGLDVVTSIGGNLMIYENASLTSLIGLESLISIGSTAGSSIHIYNNDALTSLTGLEGLTSIDSTLEILDNDALINLTGLNNVTSIGGAIKIGESSMGNQSMTSLTGLENIAFVGGFISISGNAALTSLTGLEGITSVMGSLYIDSNDALTSLEGLNNLTYIGEDLGIGQPNEGGWGNISLATLTGLENVTSIEGGVWIIGNTILTNLIGLEGLTSIGGGLEIYSNNALTNLTGLDHLTSIGGDLHIGSDYYAGLGNPSLTSLTGLENLTSIAGILRIVINDALMSLSGLDNIDAASIDGLYMYDNISLSSCDVHSVCDYLVSPNGTIEIHDNAPGCNSQDEVEEACGLVSCLSDGITFTTQSEIDNFQTNYPGCTQIDGDVNISGPFIANLNGISVLTTIEGGLRIGGLDEGTGLINLNGLEGLTYIGGDLRIISNFLLTSLTGLDNLSFINGDFYLGVHGLYFPGGNPLLTNLNGLGSLTSIGGRLSISSNHALVSLNGLDNIDTIPDLYITNNSSLSSCEAQWLCDYIANPNGSINIYFNAPGCNNPLEVADSCGISLACLPFGNYYFFSQADIDNFPTNYPDCTEIEGDLRIDGDNITSLNGLSVITSIGGDLIMGNDGSNNWPGNVNLTSLMGLEGLTSIGGSLKINYNPILISLTGLDNLNSIGEDLIIWNNYALTSLTGLDNLISIGRDLSIINGFSELTSLSGLDNLNSIGEDLSIKYNDFLSTCEAQSICTYLDDPNGEIDISNNAPGCNSQEEVEEACDDLTNVEINTAENYSIYPNPVIDIATFSSEEITSFELYDIMGVLIISRNSNTIDMSNLNPGIYFIVGFDKNNSTLYKGKIIKN